MDRQTGFKEQERKNIEKQKSSFKPVNPAINDILCDNCVYAQQDIDTDPCARCHTRH